MGILRNLLHRSPAQIAGRKASRSWQNIADHIDIDVEVLAGLDLYNHAKSEARKWLQSRYPERLRATTMWGFDQTLPENLYHTEFLEYVEAFISEFPGDQQGIPKNEPYNFE